MITFLPLRRSGVAKCDFFRHLSSHFRFSCRRSAVLLAAVSMTAAVMLTGIGGAAASAANPLRDPGKPVAGKRVAGKRNQATHQAANQAVQQVGFLDSCDGHCGSVCDCAPGCGVEVSCGCEGPCDCDGGLFGGGPSCGTEAGCGVESGLGSGYGLGAAIDRLGHGVSSFGTHLHGNACDGCDGGCDSCGEVSSIPVLLPLFRINWKRFDFGAGVTGFNGPLNNANIGGDRSSGSGSFGFYQSINEGRSLRKLLNWDMAAQLGVRFVQANLSDAAFSDESRQQVFVTGGLFRRVDYGLQYGTVIDYLNDDWFFQTDLVQTRSELSWKFIGPRIFGIQYSTSLGDDRTTTTATADDGSDFSETFEVEAVDQFRFFYRRLLANAGHVEVFAGFTDDDDGLLGGNVSVPFARQWLASAGFTYKVPNEGGNRNGFENEAWNLSMGLVYRPGGPKGCGRYCRPLFDVADNGSFLVDRN